MSPGRASMSAPQNDVFRRTAANRRRLADLLDSLTEEQLQTPSLCQGWTVRILAGHLVMPMLVPFRTALRTMASQRVSPDGACDLIARQFARRPVSDLAALLRRHANDPMAPPLVRAMGPMSDSCIHMRDMARPLGLDADVPIDDWRLVLDFLVSWRGRFGFVRPRTLAGFTLTSTDQERTWPASPTKGSARTQSAHTVSGPSEALAMAVTGRRVALDDLTGPGVAELHRRLGGD